jgi:general secretion pathway protein K
VCACSKSLRNNDRQQYSSDSSSKECGAVLIMVLLIVALVAGLSIKFAGDYQLGVARAEARWHGAQARAYLFSGEGAAIKFLANDDPSADYREELWGQTVPIALPDNMGNLLITVEDANSRFNLNSILDPLDPAKGMLEPTRYKPAQRMFIRLLQALPSEEDPNVPLVQSPDEAVAILEAIVDWTDMVEGTSGAGGAENDYYLSLPDPYQAANTPFRSIEELQMVRGVTPAIMKALRPLLSALEPNERMNINTIPEVLYRTINVSTDLAPLSQSQGSALRDDMPSAGFYSSPADFDASWNKVIGAGVADKEITTKTKYFWLTTLVQIGDQRRIGRSLLERGNPLFTVVRREESN